VTLPLFVPIEAVETALEWTPRLAKVALALAVGYIVITQGWRLAKWLTETRFVQWGVLLFVASMTIPMLFGVVDGVLVAVAGQRLGEILVEPVLEVLL
jgi:hypothetical protein